MTKKIQVAIGNDGDAKDFASVRVTGVLNAELCIGITDEELESFLREDVLKKTAKFVNAEWFEPVNADAEYIVIDHFYNEVKSIKRTYRFSNKQLEEMRIKREK